MFPTIKNRQTKLLFVRLTSVFKKLSTNNQDGVKIVKSVKIAKKIVSTQKKNSSLYYYQLYFLLSVLLDFLQKYAAYAYAPARGCIFLSVRKESERTKRGNRQSKIDFRMEEASTIFQHFEFSKLLPLISFQPNLK